MRAKEKNSRKLGAKLYLAKGPDGFPHKKGPAPVEKDYGIVVRRTPLARRTIQDPRSLREVSHPL